MFSVTQSLSIICLGGALLFFGFALGQTAKPRSERAISGAVLVCFFLVLVGVLLAVVPGRIFLEWR